MRAKNHKRTERVWRALYANYSRSRDIGQPDDLREALVDLVADIGHFCDRFSFGYEEIFDTAEAHYRAER